MNSSPAEELTWLSLCLLLPRLLEKIGSERNVIASLSFPLSLKSTSFFSPNRLLALLACLHCIHIFICSFYFFLDTYKNGACFIASLFSKSTCIHSTYFFLLHTHHRLHTLHSGLLFLFFYLPRPHDNTLLFLFTSLKKSQVSKKNKRRFFPRAILVVLFFPHGRL